MYNDVGANTEMLHPTLASPSSSPYPHYDQANVEAIRRSITNFPWQNQLNLDSDPNWQVRLFTDTILNIMSSFVPNEIKRIKPRDPPWIIKELKALLKKRIGFTPPTKKWL